MRTRRTDARGRHGDELDALTSGERVIDVFRVNDDGTLTAMPSSGVTGVFPASVTGLAAF